MNQDSKILGENEKVTDTDYRLQPGVVGFAQMDCRSREVQRKTLWVQEGDALKPVGGMWSKKEHRNINRSRIEDFLMHLYL